MIKTFSRCVLIGLILAFILTTGCNKVNNDRHLKLLLEKEVSRNIGGKLEFGKVMNFKWNRLLILSPYANFSSIEEAHKISLKPIKHSRIDLREDINQIIFFEDNKIIKMIEFPRSSGDFEDAYKSEFHVRADANFKVSASNQNKTIKNQRIILKKTNKLSTLVKNIFK